MSAGAIKQRYARPAAVEMMEIAKERRFTHSHRTTTTALY